MGELQASVKIWCEVICRGAFPTSALIQWDGSMKAGQAFSVTLERRLPSPPQGCGVSVLLRTESSWGM